MVSNTVDTSSLLITFAPSRADHRPITNPFDDRPKPKVPSVISYRSPSEARWGYDITPPIQQRQSPFIAKREVTEAGNSALIKGTKKRQAYTNATSQSSRVFEIPGVLPGGQPVNALGDYCAKQNFMKEDFALRLGLPIDRRNTQNVTIGSGKKISTTGTVNSLFCFQNEDRLYSLTFSILPNCIHNVILGKSFLKATETFSNILNKAHRVKERILNGISCRHLLYLGGSAPRFEGLLNGKPQEALADSGSKVLLMDEDYARNIGLPIITGKDHTRLMFADGSSARTSGMVYGVQWEFGCGGSHDFHFLDFHVMKNAPANVIFSDTFLFDTEAYSQYECYLVDDDDEDDEAFFFAIDIDQRYIRQGK